MHAVEPQHAWAWRTVAAAECSPACLSCSPDHSLFPFLASLSCRSGHAFAATLPASHPTRNATLPPSLPYLTLPPTVIDGKMRPHRLPIVVLPATMRDR